ncbi:MULTISPECIES: SDR family NAD(P)-dependent oxidoreductase [unclassified Mesorhizobium]|uniref:SDR family NAD(P)-dependent oxidoreductase n=1 Tax=unclassified Mesorhizobium TaxID=325217 RepID=UPI00333A14D1
MAGRLDGKAVLVTGAGSMGPGWGNGKAAAVLFAREGAKVLAADLNKAAAEETAEIIRGEGGQVQVFAGNVTDEQSVKDMVAACVEAFGSLDVLHNNVGILKAGSPLDTTVEDWDRILNINTKAFFLPCKHALPQMLKQGAGSIINISSISGFRNLGAPYIAYNTSKGSVVSFTRNLAATYAAQGIRANSILPGIIDTPMARDATIQNSGKSETEIDFDAVAKTRAARIPMKRTGTAWDIAKAALFLASDDSAYITGSEIYVDGGLNCTA